MSLASEKRIRLLHRHRSVGVSLYCSCERLQRLFSPTTAQMFLLFDTFIFLLTFFVFWPQSVSKQCVVYSRSSCELETTTCDELFAVCPRKSAETFFMNSTSPDSSRRLSVFIISSAIASGAIFLFPFQSDSRLHSSTAFLYRQKLTCV